MSDFQQKRPLSGAQNGPVSVPANGVTIHQIVSLADNAGGPQIDQISLFVQNNGAQAAIATVTVQGQAAVDVTVPANSSVRVFDEQPFLYTPLGAQSGLITITPAQGATFVAWGHFTRA